MMRCRIRREPLFCSTIPPAEFTCRHLPNTLFTVRPTHTRLRLVVQMSTALVPGLLVANVGCWMRRRFSFGLAGYLLAFLLTFAALSSAHVVREGLKSQAVSGFRLLVQVPHRFLRRIQATRAGSPSFATYILFVVFLDL